jgi:hypothetical protein
VSKTPDLAPRLVRFRLDHPSLPPPMHTMGWITVNNPDYRMEGWSLAVRGAAVFLISPRGWKAGKHKNELDARGPITAIGPIPMAHVTLIWEGEALEFVDKLQRYDLSPMTKAVAAPDEPAIDAKDLGDA